MTDDEFLAEVPILARIPDEWDDRHFYLVDTSFGRMLVLAFDEVEAERAVAVYFGRVSRPAVVCDGSDAPISMSHPWLDGPAQYLDATLAVDGDVTPMRAPDSSPALSPPVALIIDAVPCVEGHRRARAAQDRQHRYLRAQGLLAQP